MRLEWVILAGTIVSFLVAAVSAGSAWRSKRELQRIVDKERKRAELRAEMRRRGL